MYTVLTRGDVVYMMVQVKDVSKHLGSFHIKNISFEIHEDVNDPDEIEMLRDKNKT